MKPWEKYAETEGPWSNYQAAPEEQSAEYEGQRDEIGSGRGSRHRKRTLQDEHGISDVQRVSEMGPLSRGFEMVGRSIPEIGDNLASRVGLTDDDKRSARKAKYDEYKDATGTAGSVGEFVGEMVATAPLGAIGTGAKALRAANKGSKLVKALTGSAGRGAAEGAAAGAILADEGEGVSNALTGGVAGGVLGGTIGKAVKGLSRNLREGPSTLTKEAEDMSDLVEEWTGKTPDMGIYGTTTGHLGSRMARGGLAVPVWTDRIVGKGGMKRALQNQRVGAQDLSREAVLRKALGMKRGANPDLDKATDLYHKTGDMQRLSDTAAKIKRPDQKQKVIARHPKLPEYSGYGGLIPGEDKLAAKTAARLTARNNPIKVNPTISNRAERTPHLTEEVNAIVRAGDDQLRGRWSGADLENISKSRAKTLDIDRSLGPLRKEAHLLQDTLDKKGFYGRETNAQTGASIRHHTDQMGSLEASPKFLRFLTGRTGLQKKWQKARADGNTDVLRDIASAYSRTLAGSDYQDAP